MRKLFSMFPLLLLAMSSFAQQKNLTGTVSSKADNTPLAGVTVSTKNKAVQTDTTGKFSIEAATGDELTFTYVGFKPATFKVGSSVTLSIQLETVTRDNEQVVVVGYTTQRKQDLTVGSSRVDLQACKLEYSIVSPK